MIHYFKPGKTRGEKRLIHYTIHGYTFEFLTYTSLFSGRRVDEGTHLLLENIVVPDEGIVLDLGCGYGVIGIVLARINPQLRVYMVDINPLAVKVSRYNARINGVEDRVVVLQGNAYEPVKELKFDAIYSNPPISAGMDLVEKMLLDARKHLKPGGFAQFVLARGGEYLAEKARSEYSVVHVKRKKGYILLYLKP